MKNKIISYFNLFFIITFLPSFVTGTFLPNLIYFLFIVFNLFFNLDKLKQQFYENFIPCISFVIFYILLLISSLSSNYIFHSLETSFLYFTFLIYVLSIIILFQKNQKNRKLFLIFGILMSFIISFDAIYELYNGSNILSFSSIEGRIAGLFGDRWVIGRFLVYILPILIGVYFLEKKELINYKFIINVTLILVCITIIFSGERSAFLLLFLYLFLIMIFFIKKISFVKLLSILVCLLIFFISPFFFLDTSIRLQDNFILYLTSSDFTKNPYFAMFVSSWNMFIENPFLGVGPNNFRFSCSEAIYSVSQLSCNSHPHNTTFQILAELGITGYIFTSFVFIYFIYKSYLLVIIKTFSTDSFGLYSLQCAIIMYLFPLIITGNFFLSWYGFIYYFPIALYMVYSKKLK